MKILYFELRKEFIRKPFLFLLVICMAVNLFWMEWDYHTNSGFTDDFVKINASEKEISYYEELHDLLDGILDTEKVTYISEEYQKYYTLVNGDYDTEYDENMHTGYVFGDYSLLTVHFYNPIKYLITYKEQNDTLIEKAKDNIDFYTEKGNQYEVEKNTFILKHYENRNPLSFYETSGWEHLFSYDKSDLFILVLLSLGILPAFSMEQTSGMETIQITSARGRKIYLPIKITAHIFMAIVLELLFSILNFIVIHMQYGLKGKGMMLYSISEYQYTPFNISVMRFYLILVLSKCIGFATIAVIMTLIARLVKNTYAAFLITIGYVGGFLYFSGFCNGVTFLEKILAVMSPFSLLKLGEMAASMNELKICGHFFTLYSCLFGAQIMITAILLVIMHAAEKKGKVIK